MKENGCKMKKKALEKKLMKKEMFIMGCSLEARKMDMESFLV